MQRPKTLTLPDATTSNGKPHHLQLLIKRTWLIPSTWWAVISLENIARILGISVGEAERRAVKALVREELRRVRAEKASILARYGVKGFDELWRLVEEDAIDDTTIHDDIVRLDYLEHREKELEKLLKELET